MYDWLIKKGYIDRSPLDRMGPPFKEPERSRVLKLAELVVLWIALDGVTEPFRSFYRLLILLGQRLRETAGVPWAEIDFATDEWLLPRERTKNYNDHLVPLSTQAAELLEAMQPKVELRRGFVFTTDGRTCISGFSKAKIAVDEAIARLIAAEDRARALVGDSIEPWVPHDLRRSLATGCQAMGVALAHTEAILNHVSGKRAGVVGIYHLHDFYDEKADALDKWGALITAALKCWDRGDIEGIRALDPARRKRRVLVERGYAYNGDRNALQNPGGYAVPGKDITVDVTNFASYILHDTSTDGTGWVVDKYDHSETVGNNYSGQSTAIRPDTPPVSTSDLNNPSC